MRQEQYNLALEVLSTSDWLKDYPGALVRQLVAEGRLVRLNVGEWAQAEGDDRSGLFVVIDGSLHSFCAAPGGRAVMIGVVGAGAVLGHATRYSGCWKFPRRRLSGLRSSSPKSGGRSPGLPTPTPEDPCKWRQKSFP